MRVIVVDDDYGALYSIKKVLSSSGFEVIGLQSPVDLEEYIPYADVLLMDIRLEKESGINVVEKLRTKGFNIPIIFITAYTDADAVVKASKLGAVDILKKPFGKEDLLKAIDNAVKSPLKVDTAYSKEFKVVGSSKAMFEVFKKVGLACCNDMNVLITGETGVGKEVIAKLIHQNSDRRDKPFVIIHCPAIPWDLFEAELFGYVRGAFTGATTDKKGKAQLAEGGMLFLDEIGDFPYKLQAKLLAFVERKTFFPLGSSKEVKADVRLIFATNKDLKKMVEEGKFREDLYHRISQIHIHIPPLRERKEDIKPLVEYFINLANAELGTSVEGVEEEALNKLLKYTFPGNVRELKNIVYKAVLETRFGKIKNFEVSQTKTVLSLEEILGQIVDATPEEELPNLLKDIELCVIKRLLEKYQGNKSKVASLLGISRNTLESRLRTLDQP